MSWKSAGTVQISLVHAAGPRHAISPADAERWLLAREPLGMHFGLERMEQLMRELGDPQRAFRSVHVVGTNGKSSTVRMTAAILRRHGLRVGAYLSPHLRSFAERIEVDEQAIGEQEFAAAVARVAQAAARVDAERHPEDRVTQFEALTAAAYAAFADHDVEVAVVEAGLGGRLDATSVIASEVQVLTSIALEHTALLGDTHVEIAGEKLAVVRDGGTLVLGATLPADVEALADEVAAAHGARVVRAGAEPSAEPSARGGFQRRNFALAEAAAEAFHGELDGDAVRDAAAAVRTPGRLETLDRAPLTLLDAAHNAHGVAALLEALPDVLEREGGSAPDAGERLVAVVSILSDKDADAMLTTLLPRCAALVATGNSSPRARDPRELARRVEALGGPPVTVEPDPHAALEAARALAGEDGVVLATGSICLVGDLLR
ncbi:MAG TPA: cyanophycin synthetase [Conexibacter sp.]|nr:cyanophycin synthetase [Conexibacter sp.]